MPLDKADDILNANIADAARTFAGLSVHGPALGRAVKLLTDCLTGGHKLLVCGNGGSSADASHIVAEIVGRFVDDRRGYPAIALSDPTGVLTAVSNDYGFDNVYARQVEAFGRRGDVLLVISTSGNSPNILRALEMADKIGLTTISLLGKDGGKARGLAAVEMIVEQRVTARVQEAHQLLYHSLCQALDAGLCRADSR
jgi:D-sedoheptulose 7-phosphate isomerase